MNELISLNYNGNNIRSIEQDGEFWVVLKDVCEILGIHNHKDIPKRLDADEVGRFELPHPTNVGKSLEMLCINESGLYSVILRSDKPEAKPFRRWVTHEVLPTIRKTGSFSLVPKKECKTWYGVPVLTLEDAAEYFGTTKQSARSKIMTYLRNGLDYFVISGETLKLFKFENREIKNMVTQIFVIRQEEFLKQFGN